MAECVRRLRGLPYEATVLDIHEWLKDYQVVDHGIDIQVNANGCPMGQAWVEFASADVATAAQANMHKQHMGSRYIEVLLAQPSDLLERGKQRSVLSTTPSGPTVVKLRGLPWSADEAQVLKFIGASSLQQQHATIVRNARGRSTGEAFVQLPSEFNRASVMRKHNTKLEGRTIDITPSTVEEMRVYVSAMADPRHAEPAPRSAGNNVSPHTLWLRGMPFTCTESDVANFFCGLNIRRRGISLFQDYYGELTGEAVVQFETAADLAAARLREKQFMQNRFIEWQRQPSCNPERLGRIFTNNDPMYRLSWERGELPQEEEYAEGYDESTYPDPYGYPYPPHPHDGAGYDYPPYPPMYPHQQPHPQSYYPPAYAGGHYDQSGAMGGPHQGHQHGGYPPAGYPGYGPQHPQQMYPPPPHYTNPNYPPHGYPPHPSYPPHYGAYPPQMYGGEQAGGYWGEHDQQYEGGVVAEGQEAAGVQEVTGAEGQEREAVEGAEEEAAGSEDVEGTLSGQSSVEGITEHTNPTGPKQGEKQETKGQGAPTTASAAPQQKSTHPSSAPNNNGTYRGTYAQHARHGGPPRGRGGYGNNAGPQQRYSRN